MDGSFFLCTMYLRASGSNTDTQSSGKRLAVEYLQSHSKHTAGQRGTQAV